jgi:hypothetical protein
VYLFPQILKTDFQRDRWKSVFARWWLPPPNPFSQNFILRLRTVPALFSPVLRGIFEKRGNWHSGKISTPASPRQNFLKGIDRNIRLCYHDEELNTAHIFYADT